MNKVIYIACHTKGNYATVFKEKLLPSLIKWNLPFDVEVFDDNYTWIQATHLKTQVCKRMLLKHKKPIVYIDVDATIEQNPILFGQLDCDIAYNLMDWYWYWKKEQGCSKREILTGTLYFDYNEKVLQFLDDCIKENKNRPNISQQFNMKPVLKEWKNRLNIYELPKSYCTIINRDNTIPYWYEKNPVILHWQASRKYKHRP